MVTTRAAMESRVENLERSVREWRNESRSQLDELKRLLKGSNRNYTRGRSRRGRSPKYRDEEDSEDGKRDGRVGSVHHPGSESRDRESRGYSSRGTRLPWQNDGGRKLEGPIFSNSTVDREDEGVDAVVAYRFQATVDGGEEEINGEGEGKGGSSDLFGVDQTTPTIGHGSKLEMVSDPRWRTGEEMPELSKSGSKEKLSSDLWLRPTNVRREGVNRDKLLEMGGGWSRSVNGCYEVGGLGGKKGGGLGNGLDGRCEGGGWDESEERHQADGSSTATEVANSCTQAKHPLPEPPDLDPRPTAEGQAVEVQANMVVATRSSVNGKEKEGEAGKELQKLKPPIDLMGQAQLNGQITGDLKKLSIDTLVYVIELQTFSLQIGIGEERRESEMGVEKQVVRPDTGPKPVPGQNVTVHYTGYGKNGDLSQKLLEPRLPQLPGNAPYRSVLGNVKDKLERSRKRLELLLEVVPCDYDPLDYYETSNQLLEPLLLCHEFLQSCGSGVQADGQCAALICRVATFGMVLTKLDLHQEPGRHVETLDAITRYLDMGTYSEWDKEKKLNFLTRKLKGKSSLVHLSIGVPPDVKEVLDTFRIAAALGSDSPRAYVISRASNASDVLAVELLQKDAWLVVIGELGKSWWNVASGPSI